MKQKFWAPYSLTLDDKYARKTPEVKQRPLFMTAERKVYWN
jgi:hypothetical protein